MAKRAAKRKSGVKGVKKNTVMVPVIAPAGTERSHEAEARVGTPSQGAVSDNPVGSEANPAGTPPGWEPPTRHAPTGPALAQDEQVLVVWEKGKGVQGHEGKLSEIRRMAEKRKETGEIYKGTESIGKVYPNGTVETWHRYASNPLPPMREENPREQSYSGESFDRMQNMAQQRCRAEGHAHPGYCSASIEASRVPSGHHRSPGEHVERSAHARRRGYDDNPRERGGAFRGPSHSEMTKLEYVEGMRALERQIERTRDALKRQDLIARLWEAERDFKSIQVWGQEREEPTHREWYREHRTPLRFEENPRSRQEPQPGALVRFDLRGAMSPMYEGREYHQTMVFRGSVGNRHRLEMPDGHEISSALPIIEVSRWGPGPRRSEAYYRGEHTSERASDRPVGRHGEHLSDEELHRGGNLDVGHPRRTSGAAR